MQLSRQNLKNISHGPEFLLPEEAIFSLSEKVLQFGTGVLLRALPDYFIDKANRQGVFNGRIVVVKSTSQGSIAEFARQDNLYTLCLRGITNGQVQEQFVINSSISRVLSATSDWTSVLQCAENRELRIIISNTTEVGIVLTDDNIHDYPPKSFPGKLLSFLFKRYQVFNGSKESGMIIVPTELIIDNGNKLRSIILDLAKMNKLDDGFIEWLKIQNHFCSSLVDRIVPGKLSQSDQSAIEARLGYSDALMITAETFGLWAIETDCVDVQEALSFSSVNEGMILCPDIGLYRELKLRLLNGTHSFTCGLAVRAGFATVREAMNNSHFASFIHDIAIDEIANAVTSSQVPYATAREFAEKTLERFRNPFLDHKWINISAQYSEKMKQRAIPLLIKHYNKFSETPRRMALGFAAFLLFMKCRKDRHGNFVGEANGVAYTITDDHAEYFAEIWSSARSEMDHALDKLLGDEEFWGTNLSLLNGFAEAVKKNVYELSQQDVLSTIRNLDPGKTKM